MYKIEDIDDYKNRLTEEQKEKVVRHCNKYNIYPRICAWYDDMDDKEEGKQAPCSALRRCGEELPSV